MMSKMILLLVGVLGIAGFGSAQLVQVGQCGTINYMDNFVLASFIGTNGIWNEIGKTANQVDDCSRFEFGTGTATVTLSNPSVVNNFAQTATGTATHTTGTSTLTLTLTSSNNPFEFNILASDYNNYAIGMNCVNLGTNQRSINVWLLGRAANSLDTPATLTAVNNALAAIGSNVNQLTAVDHSTDACTVLPVISPGQPVILSGQCSTTTPVIQNFQVGQFEGTWYEISSYYSENAVGTCARADYTLAGNTVNVVNSQVLNGRLDTISGTAALIGTNQEGRLNVVLNVNGVQVTQELLILDTDYNGYAVSYTCVNLENNQRRVNSWILSRTQTISATSQTEVNRVINSLVDLNTEYYQNTDQSDAACFYYPIFTPGVPVVFPGQCDLNIPVQANFDPTQYTNLWYDIESYPSTFQQGTCNNAFYTLTPEGTVDVFNTQVVDQRLDTMRGVAVIPDPTQPAKLLVSFPIAGTDQTTSTNYWVLATDYTSYSLVYTCENLANNQRAVFSWKLGRTKEAFSAAANTAMNAVINSIDVLDSQYFANRDQSAAGCFYFPEPELGRPVIFPGQCDQTVAAIPNFNLNQFIGTWHEVQAYPKEQQSGTCVNHDFTTTTATNTLNLVSNQVIAQRLSSSSGNVVVETTDGSGRLRLSMTVNGVAINFPYWVLATDYTSYALVYSCMDRQDDTRAVYSWKLSRTQTLPEAANTPINTAIAAVQVLDNQYYEAVDQSANGCFYFPIYQPGVPVVFPGQCDQSIPVQANFDPTQYTNLWHDIESYPSTFQQGTCNNAFYTLTPEGTVDVFNTQVVDQRLDTMRGVAVIPDPTQPAKLLVTFPIAGTDQTISTNYWILATDYTSYSLVYTCENLPNNQKAVFSWKMGRNKAAFSAAANAAMNAVINTIDVLDSQYFANRDQSDAGCFYFPEPEVGRPVIFPGQCDQTVAAFPNFNLNQFVGTWHEVETYPKEQQSGTCVNHDFTATTAANTLNLVSNQVIAQRLSSSSGNVVVESTDGSGRLRLSMTVNGVAINFPYWVLATDYTSYALVYSCMDRQDGTRAVYSWKLSRTQTLPEAANTPINTAIAAVQVLDNQYYEAVDQSANGCFYFPIFQPGVPVVFPGQCDQSIPVQANFDPTLYTNLWHDIESYPSTFQQGTCNNAFYTLTPEGTVDVFNTQVVDQRLDTMRGVAVIPDPTQPAKLLVTFPIAGTDQTISTNYWILATDYTSYSLVYTCENLPNNQKAVFSWKMGRNKAAFSAAANAAMNAVINTIDVLDSQYFANRDQSDAGCFYFPEPEVGRPVIFPGQCDQTVAAFPNFNLNQFVGTWHEVQTYPKEQQSGTCVNHDFTATTAANTLNLVSNQVISQTLSSSSGNVVVESTDGSGRLRLSMTVNGVAINFPYWVLATDYTSYALVYSCMDRQDDTRAVYSWKLSRTQTLPEAANTPINTAIAAVQVLDNQYYEAVDQSANGCFFYPIFQPGVPVFFPGQCDQSIPVQANFDPTQYTGLWHDIESYPSTFQQGTCNNAFYTLTQEGTVDVFNTQVVDQRLDTMRGVAVIPDPTQPAKLLVTFPIAGTDQTTSTNYWVLATDYTSYSLVYTCANISNNQRAVFSWKLGRAKAAFSAAANTAMNAVINTIDVLDSQYFANRDQSVAGCFYFPEPEAGRPVIFPGQCEETVAALPNFNMAQFVGTWHEVQTYPKEQQTGTCVNHAFSSGATTSTLNLVSNQVINQIANSASGSVAFDSTDGSGRLRLSMTVNGLPINFPYWVLATDYTSYALIYSCMNRQDDTRAVYSWKISRTQTLPDAANIPINAAIAAVQVLDNQYYEPVDQSAAACRSYPEIPAGDPIVIPGQCETVVPVANFQSAQFAGNWYEAARYPSQRQSGDCAASQFTTSQNGFTLSQTIVYNERLTVVSGPVTLPTDGSGVLTAVLTDGTITYTTTIYVLDTDYADFALLYSCENIAGSDSRQLYSWKLSRLQAGLSQSANDRIAQVIANTEGLVEVYYQPTGQTSNDCFYYPVFTETPDSIILPGACPTISAKPNFEPARYLGSWFDVASYPIESQNGTCSRAEYTLVDGVITIRNTMVVDEELRVQNGIARLSSAGTGLLTVTFILENGVEVVTTYYVLETDYSSFSLVYNCRNLADGSRQVFSWKLSRTPELTPEANAIINNIVSNTQGLLDDYYLQTSQSDEDCFYVPEPVPGQSVLFRGACTVPTLMQNFNVNQYLGWWHEIERYPSDDVAGECTSTNLIQGSTSIQVVDSSVNNGAVNETTGTAAITTTGIITITKDNVQTIWYVLDTDYTSYSLVYSCDTITTDWGPYRRVWSAKHSKTRSLSAADNAAINAVIATNPLLRQEFFDSVNQSNAACFHYRDDASEQVILPGQCDTQIPVQAGFEVSRFAGTWYQIERYPYPQVSNEGTCVGTRYTPNNDGLTVLNWEVLDGTLNTIEGTATVDAATATLNVNLPQEGEAENRNMALRVLLTDYDNYALLYTCVNINSFQRSVGAFKVSRARSLSNDAQYAIENYMAPREEFHLPYFISISHDNQCVEPSSALIVKSSIIVMLVCFALQLVM